MAYSSAVPFSPIPTEPHDVAFEPGGWTYSATPIRVMWEQAYRDAAHKLIWGDVEDARVLARMGRDMEDAYITRVAAESRARREAKL